MSVVGFAAERPDSPKATFLFNEHVITRKFRVTCTSVNDGPIVVANAPGIPRMFTRYYNTSEFHPYCRVRSIDPQRIHPASNVWEVTVTYRTPDPKSWNGNAINPGTGTDNDGQYENPLLELPDVETHFETKEVPIYGALFSAGFTVNGMLKRNNQAQMPGNAPPDISVGDSVVLQQGATTQFTTIDQIQQNVANGPTNITFHDNWIGKNGRVFVYDQKITPLKASNGEIFVPAPVMDQSRLILTISRNEDLSAPHPALSLLYQDAVNRDVFWGAAPGQVKINAIKVVRQVRQIANGLNYPFLRVTYEFHFKPTWITELLDKGTWYWTTDNPKRKQRFLSDDGQPIDGLLDGGGGKLPDGANPQWRVAMPYNLVPFAPLNLPQSFTQVQ